jgi:hypothetical protein
VIESVTGNGDTRCRGDEAESGTRVNSAAFTHERSLRWLTSGNDTRTGENDGIIFKSIDRELGGSDSGIHDKIVHIFISHIYVEQ